jgi:hypothetical protein
MLFWDSLNNYLLGGSTMAKTLTIWMKDEDLVLLDALNGDSMSEKIRMCIRQVDPIQANHYAALVRQRETFGGEAGIVCRKCGE